MPATSVRAYQALFEPLERRMLFAIAAPGLTESYVLINGGPSGFHHPTAMEFAPDGRLFVAVEQGQVRVFEDGSLLETPFLSRRNEQVFWGITLDPSFATNGYVYVYHTLRSPEGSGSRITRYTADPGNPDVMLAGSGVPILDLADGNGAIHFGGDGKLYVTVVGPSASDAQSLNSRRGKMLRINSDGSIPTDNPFYNTATGANRAIWALGLANPYRFAVQPGTGTIYINDAGPIVQEINRGEAGANYGWPGIDGKRTTQPLPTIGNYRDPLLTYRRGAGDSHDVLISGSTFYNPPTPQLPPDYIGDYFYADGRNGWIRKYDPATDTSTLIATGGPPVVDLDVAPDGSLYVLEPGSGAGGSIRRIRGYDASPSAPDLVPASDTGASDTDNVTADNTLTFTGAAPANARVLIVMDDVTVVGETTAAGDGSYSVTTGVVPDGVYRFTARATAAGVPSASAALTVTVDTRRPRLGQVVFDYQTGPHKLRYSFQEDVGASLSPSDVVVDNALPGSPPFSPTSTSYDLATNTATFTFDNFPGGVLANGNYRATLFASGVADAAGNTLVANVPPNDTLEFFVLHGDVNRDRAVDGTDFGRLAANFGKTGQTYAGGDLNGDTSVNGSDFAVLASNFGQSLPSPEFAATTTPGRPLAAPSSHGVAAARGLERRRARLRPRPLLFPWQRQGSPRTLPV